MSLTHCSACYLCHVCLFAVIATTPYYRFYQPSSPEHFASFLLGDASRRFGEFAIRRAAVIRIIWRRAFAFRPRRGAARVESRSYALRQGAPPVGATARPASVPSLRILAIWSLFSRTNAASPAFSCGWRRGDLPDFRLNGLERILGDTGAQKPRNEPVRRSS